MEIAETHQPQLTQPHQQVPLRANPAREELFIWPLFRLRHCPYASEGQIQPGGILDLLSPRRVLPPQAELAGALHWVPLHWVPLHWVPLRGNDFFIAAPGAGAMANLGGLGGLPPIQTVGGRVGRYSWRAAGCGIDGATPKPGARCCSTWNWRSTTSMRRVIASSTLLRSASS